MGKKILKLFEIYYRIKQMNKVLLLLGDSSHCRRSSYNMERGKLRYNSVGTGDTGVNSFFSKICMYNA